MSQDDFLVLAAIFFSSSGAGAALGARRFLRIDKNLPGRWLWFFSHGLTVGLLPLFLIAFLMVMVHATGIQHSWEFALSMILGWIIGLVCLYGKNRLDEIIRTMSDMEK